MTSVRDTSILTYEEIKDKGFKDTWEEYTYETISRVPLMTAREYFDVIMEDATREQVFPRITELKQAGMIIEVHKRKCSVGGRLSYVYATIEGLEVQALKNVGFKEVKDRLFMFKEDEIICFQDFRKGSRCSYAMTESRETADYKHLDCYKKFKQELESLRGGDNE